MKCAITRAVAVLGLLLGVGMFAPLISPTPAFADTTSCSGNSYSTCTSVGYTDHGYGASNATSYWGAYAGHNCTNYVAYVEQAVNGAPTPGYLLGNASDWATNADAHGATVNSLPAQGSVAQWNASAMHPPGHVAYVESVSADSSGSVLSIAVSYDNYPAGPFGWQTISAGSSSWPNNFIHFADIPSGTNGRPRIADLDSNHALWIKEGPIGAGWTEVAAGVDQFQLSPNRIAILQGSTLSVKEGALGAPWTTVGTGVSAFRVTDGRVGALFGSSLAIKEGTLGTSWTTVATGVTDFDMSPSRIAVLDGSAGLSVKEGSLGASWTPVASSVGVGRFHVTDSRVGVLWDTDLYIKDGPLGAGWTLVINPTSDFKLSPNRIIAKQIDGTLYVKEGAIGSGLPWCRAAPTDSLSRTRALASGAVAVST